jgi:hypothetical protein
VQKRASIVKAEEKKKRTHIVHEEQSTKREMKDGREGSSEVVCKGEISTLLTGVPGLATVRALSTDVAMLVTFEAPLDAGAAALVELVTEGVFNAVGVILKAVLDVLVVVLFRAHAGVSLGKGTAESTMSVAVLEVGVEGNLVWSVIGVEMVASGAGMKGVGMWVEAGHGDRALITSEEGEEVAGLILVIGEVLEDFMLMGNKAS